MPTMKELEKELGLEPGTLTGKAEIAAKWDGYLSEGLNAKAEAEQKFAAAQKALSDAQLAQQTIDDQIANFGVTESRLAQAEAANAAYKAAMDKMKEQGFTFEGVTMPEPPPHNNQPDPMKSILDNTSRGFANMTQAINVSNRYQRVFGKAMPDNLDTLANEAANNRMTIDAYAERKYGFSAAEEKQREEAQRKHDEEIGAAAVKRYQEEHPVTAGNPNLAQGVSSNYPAMTKPRDSKSLREFASLSTREKIASAMQRSNDAAAQRA